MLESMCPDASANGTFAANLLPDNQHAIPHCSAVSPGDATLTGTACAGIPAHYAPCHQFRSLGMALPGGYALTFALLNPDSNKKTPLKGDTDHDGVL